MKILGLCLNDYNTSAALVIDGRVVAAAREERFNREKLTRRFPSGALAYCLGEGGLGIDDLDVVAAPVNPALYLGGAPRPVLERARFRGELLYAYPGFLAGHAPHAPAGTTRLVIPGAPAPRTVHYVTHHDAHAALAHLGSGFEDAAVISIDAFAERETCAFYATRGGHLERLASVPFPHSLGCFYAAITELLGLRPFDEEWKVMGAAARGDAARFLPVMRDLVRVPADRDTLGFELALEAFGHYLFDRPGLFDARLEARLGARYAPGDVRDQRFHDIAAAAQRRLEEVVLELVARLVARTGIRTVCLSGGVAMNCVLNGRLVAAGSAERLYVPPVPDDSGGSLGAALHVAHAGGDAVAPITSAAWGPAFGDDEIEAELERCRIAYRRTDDPAREAARLVAAGHLVGWFQGRMELGDRALGGRSILADPRRTDVERRLRATVKPREAFQPFAPAAPRERASTWFEGDLPSPFMERTVRTRGEHRTTLAAVTHHDGSARLQTVDRELLPEFHALLVALEDEIGVPIVLNTSFNASGEPIVCTPRDAVRTFFGTGLDALVVGRFVIEKATSGPTAT